MSVLLIAPQDRQAWLVGPDHDAARDGVPLCAAHADRVTVPFGWQLRDDRPAAKPRPRRRSRTRTPKVATPPEPTDVGDATDTDASPAAVEAAEASEPAVEAAEPIDAAPADADADSGTPRAEAGEADPGDPAQDRAGDPSPEHGTDGATPARRRAPSDVSVHADDVAAAVAGTGTRLTVVPGDDDPTKTFAIEADGQTALWADSHRDDHEPSDETPLLKRAFRVVRED